MSEQIQSLQSYLSQDEKSQQAANVQMALGKATIDVNQTIITARSTVAAAHADLVNTLRNAQNGNFDTVTAINKLRVLRRAETDLQEIITFARELGLQVYSAVEASENEQ